MSPVKIKVPGHKNEIASRPSPFEKMTKQQRSDMDTMLIGGASTTDVIKHFREEEGLFVEMKDDSIRKAINRYRKGQLTKNVVATVLGGTAQHKGTAEKLLKNLDTMGEMETLIEIQKLRFLKMYEKEKDAPLLMEVVTREAVQLQKMLVDLAHLQLDSGIIRRAPRTVQGQMMDEKGNVRSFSWTEEQAELYKTLESVTYAEKAN